MNTTTTTPGDASWPPIPTRLLVHALVRGDGTVDAGELYAVAGLLGMTDQQVRLCVKRLVAEGRFTHEGRGRKALLRATPDATGAIDPDVDLVRHAYRQDHGLAPWNGTWYLFAFAVPESRRTARDALRDTLLHLGATPLQGGLYVCANPITPLVEIRAHELGVSSALTHLTSDDLRVGDLTDPTALAAALWPLDEIAERHSRLAALARACLDRIDAPEALTGPERLTMAVRLAAAFTEAMEPDPLLPPELLPQPWEGAESRRLAAACWSALAEADAADGASPSGPRLFSLYEGVMDGPQRDGGEHRPA
ncbi:transcriptional regulator [Nocardiopsis sp. EMB25]|uniref:PaaX family transcriptional regulator C-terminal domain-containing protein n=1 Tax=Nocardiopsis sp. EMB25 TaxID=2835867 RepID=UPI002283AA6F|nr:PaaX family transcriptional regulator C-terminal domain-containing protein [Nocardiopsis sp. EMB25]MCY9786690.1 transcriptional regulator [Nocardiopsis sp. EMB25]